MAAGIVMNASKNEDFVKENEDLINSVHQNEDGSSEFSANSSIVKGAYIPPEEAAKLLEMFGTSVVQDFEDDYHLTKKERDEMQERYQKFFKLKKGFTRKIRKLDKFVQAYRLCIEIINDIAATNGIYSPEKFREKALSGAIKIEGLTFPKFQGKKKKKINWEHVISEYILDPTRDIRELTEAEEIAKETQHDTYELPNEVVDELFQPKSQEEEDLEDFKASIGKVGGAITGEMSKKEQKWLAKKCPVFIQHARDVSKMSGESTRSKMHAYDTDDTELELIRAYDDKIMGANSLDMPKFSGDFNDTDAVDAYLLALDEYEKQTSFVAYNGRMITEEKAEELAYIGALEAAGWNVRNLYDNKDRDKENLKAEKAEKKRVDALRKMLSDAQLKENLRKKGFTDKEIEAYMRKREEQGSKNKKKKKKAKDAMSSVILDATKSHCKSFKKYKKKMERM